MLESRQLLTASVEGLSLLQDTGTSSVDGITYDPTVSGTVSWTDPAAINVTIEFDHNDDGAVDGVSAPVSINGGSFSYTPSAIGDGTVNLKYRADEDGLSYSDWQTYTFTYDTTAPTVVSFNPAEGTSYDPSSGVVSVTFDEEVVPSWSMLSLNSPGGHWPATGAQSATDASTIEITFTASELTAPQYTTTVWMAADVAGNYGGTDSATWNNQGFNPASLSGAALVFDSGVSSSDLITYDGRVQVTADWTNADNTGGVTVEFDQDGDGTADGSAVVATSGGSATFTPTGLSDGSATIRGRVVETGHTSAWTDLLTFTYDTTAPTVVSFNPAEGTSYDPSSGVVSVTFDEEVVPSWSMLSLNSPGGHWPATGAQSATDASTIEITFTASELTAPQYTTTVWMAADVAGNYGGTDSATWNNQGFNPASLSGAALVFDSGVSPSDLITNDGRVQVTANWTNADNTSGVTVEFDQDGDGTADGSAVVAASGNSATFTPTGLSDGSATIRGRVVETGHTGAWTDLLTFTYDTTAPTVVSFNPAEGTSYDPSSGVVSVTFDEEVVPSWSMLSLNSPGGHWPATGAQSATDPSTIEITFTASELTAPQYTTTVWMAADVAGNYSGTDSATWNNDAFNAASLSGAALVFDSGVSSSDLITYDGRVQVTADWTNADNTGGVTVEFDQDGDGTADGSAVVATSGGSATFTPTGLSDGSVTIRGRVVETGHTSAWTDLLTFTYDTTAPTVVSFNPAEGTSYDPSSGLVSVTFDEEVVPSWSMLSLNSPGGHWPATGAQSATDPSTIEITFTASELTAPQYTTTVWMAADVAGNYSGTDSATWNNQGFSPASLSGAALVFDSGVSPSDLITNDGRVQVTADWTNADNTSGVTVEFDQDGDGTADGSAVVAASGNSATFTPTGLSDGSATIRGRVVETGHTGAWTDLLTFTYDTTAPTVVSFNPAEGTSYDPSSGVVSVTFDEEVVPSWSMLSLNSPGGHWPATGAQSATDASTIEITFTASELTAPQYTTTVWMAADVAGNYGGTDSATWNNQGFNPASLSGAALVFDSGVSPSDLITNDGRIQVTANWTNADNTGGVTVEFDQDGDGTADGSTVVAASGNSATFTPVGLSDGSVTIRGRVVETGHTSAWTDLLTFTYDTTAPTVVSFNPAEGTSYDPSSGVVSVTFDEEVVPSWSMLSLNSPGGHWPATGAQSATDPSTIEITFTASELTAPQYTTTVWMAADVAGNYGGTDSATWNNQGFNPASLSGAALVFDSGVSPSDLITNDGRVQVTANWTNADNTSGVTVEFDQDGDGTADGSAVVAASGNSATFTPVGLSDGSVTIRGRVVETGHTGAWTDLLTFTYDTTAPTVVSFSPAEGSVVTGVPNVLVSFDEDLDSSSVTSSNIHVEEVATGGQPQQTLQITGARNVQIDLPSALAADNYATKVSAVIDLAGNVMTSEASAAWRLNAAPTTAGIPDQFVDEDAADIVLSLFDFFADTEDADNQLTFEIVGNTNSALFETTSIDEISGQLTLALAADAFGVADLTIRVTDLDGASVETTFTVDVQPVNDAPQIIDFIGIPGITTWTFTGQVIDENPEGLLVTFSGVLAGHSVTTDINGFFALFVPNESVVEGFADAMATDTEGLQSELASYFVDIA